MLIKKTIQDINSKSISKTLQKNSLFKQFSFNNNNKNKTNKITNHISIASIKQNTNSIQKQNQTNLNYQKTKKQILYKSAFKYSNKANTNDLLNNVQNLYILKLQKTFDEIFNDFKFEEIISENKQEKKLKGLTENKNFIYGEANLQAMLDILRFIEANDKSFFADKNKLFLDIGSGTGKAVIAMSLLGKFAKCVGVEIMENLHFKSELALEKLNRMIIESKEEENLQKSQIVFLFEDILNTDFSQFDVIFANSTCWTKEFIKELHPKILQIKKGAFFFNTDQVFYPDLCANTWEKHEKFKTQMSWGDSNVYVIRKL